MKAWFFDRCKLYYRTCDFYWKHVCCFVLKQVFQHASYDIKVCKKAISMSYDLYINAMCLYINSTWVWCIKYVFKVNFVGCPVLVSTLTLYFTYFKHLKCWFCILDDEFSLAKAYEFMYERCMLIFLFFALETCEWVWF